MDVNSLICKRRMRYRPFVSLNNLLLLNMKCWPLKELLSRPGILLHPRASAAHGSHLRMSSEVSDTRVQKASLVSRRAVRPSFIPNLLHITPYILDEVHVNYRWCSVGEFDESCHGIRT